MSDNNEKKGNYYIIADHLRTTIFALADGAVFEPKGRGYILKKLVKRATLLAYLFSLKAEHLQKISEKLIEINSAYYTHLSEKKDLIIRELKREVGKAMEFIIKSVQELDNHYSPKINAEEIFFWYDTKGIPLELIRFHLKNKQCQFPEKEFSILLEKQKEKGRKDRENKKVATF